MIENYRDKEYGDFTITCFLIIMLKMNCVTVCEHDGKHWVNFVLRHQKLLIFFRSYFKSLNFKKYKFYLYKIIFSNVNVHKHNIDLNFIIHIQELIKFGIIFEHYINLMNLIEFILLDLLLLN